MSFQLLLVDDEIHTIEGIRADLNLHELGIVKLMTAHSAKRAKEVFQTERVDIMVCDIEMPQESGLELMAWTRRFYPQTITIFLTAHADFKYAREALKLGSLDYLLKPVNANDLESAIRKAKGVLDKDTEVIRNGKSHQLWMKHHPLVIERFWLDLINHTIPSSPSAIHKQIEIHNLPFTEGMLFMPVLISTQMGNKELTRRDEKILEYGLKKTAEEILSLQHLNGLFCPIERGTILGMFAVMKEEPDLSVELRMACNHYIEISNRFFGCDLCCYIGKITKIHDVAEMVAELRTQAQNNVAFFNMAHLYNDDAPNRYSVRLPDVDVWISLLRNSTREIITTEVQTFLYHLVENHEIDANILRQFHQDFIQAVYAYLDTKEIRAHQLLGDEESRYFSESAMQSVTDMLAWVHHVVNRVMHQVDTVDKPESVVKHVVDYIAENIDQDLTRDIIATQVCLNPDYLSRIFKREKKHSISEYVLLERISLAKKLLSQSHMPISDVAASVGYSNFSHFTKIFKKNAGTTPTEFRQLTSTD